MMVIKKLLKDGSIEKTMERKLVTQHNSEIGIFMSLEDVMKTYPNILLRKHTIINLLVRNTIIAQNEKDQGNCRKDYTGYFVTG